MGVPTSLVTPAVFFESAEVIARVILVILILHARDADINELGGDEDQEGNQEYFAPLFFGLLSI